MPLWWLQVLTVLGGSGFSFPSVDFLNRIEFMCKEVTLFQGLEWFGTRGLKKNLLEQEFKKIQRLMSCKDLCGLYCTMN